MSAHAHHMYSARQVDTSPRVRVNPSLVSTIPPPLKLDASNRGGPALALALPQRGLTPRERADPRGTCRGPALLYRDVNGAPQSGRSQLDRFEGDLYDSGSPTQNRRLFLIDGDAKKEAERHIRDGHLPAPLQQETAFLTSAERANPQRYCRGPSLLRREKHSAAQSSHKHKVRDPSRDPGAMNKQVFLLADGNYMEAPSMCRTDKLQERRSWHGLTQDERADPMRNCVAPELLTPRRAARRPEYYVDEPCCTKELVWHAPAGAP